MNTMKFEYDLEKSEASRRKHGIDFVDAQMLWEDPDCLLVPARTQGEVRIMLIGKINTKHWAAIFTPRSEGIRIISVRRARPQEVKRYED